MKIAFGITLAFLLQATCAFSQATGVNEGTFLAIGGIDQWVTIKGTDASKPIILFLHGGPGSVMSPYADAIYGGWEKEFVLVNWDQRGAGRTFGRNAPADVNEDYWISHPLTVDQMVTDGVALSEYILKKFGQEKLILIGTSWGSVLGAHMALKRPDLFYAYVGHSQIVNPSASLIHAYNRVTEMAKQAKDTTAQEKLTSLGPPPFDDARKTGQILRIIKKYESQNATPAPEAWWKLPEEYDNETDHAHRANGDDYSFIHYAGHKALGIEPMSAGIDLMKEKTDFKIPVYLIQGEHDILTPKELTSHYFQKINAPKKKLILVPGAAHGHNASIVKTQHEVLTKYVLPLTGKY